MIFTAICVFGFIFVCVALPFALRYESRRRKVQRQIDLSDWPWPDDPQLWTKYPNYDPGPFPPRPKAK